jgi:mycofactocin precursor
MATVVAMEQDTPQEPTSVAAESDIVEELLVEEISIDGMCGVY